MAAPLQPDQRALLQLLCERGQNYSDIAELLGTTPEEARDRARGALTTLGGADPDAEVNLTDYLLGQADPIGRADAVRYLQAEPEAHDLATRIEEALREIAPDANLPKLPEPRGRARRAAVPASDSPSSAPARTGSEHDGPDGPRTSRQTRMIAAIAAGGLILLIAILAIAGVFGGDDGESGSTASAGTDETTATTGADDPIVDVDLQPAGDTGVAGTASFGIVDDTQPYVDLEVQGLDPKLAKDETYLFWLILGETGGYPIPQPLTPDQNGTFSGRLAIPQAEALVASRATNVRVSLTSRGELAGVIETAVDQEAPIVPFTGELLAEGEIPVVRESDGQVPAPAPGQGG